ncbi:hypothetical protein [Natronorubrum tibetense]|uniref:hypothetical protein n=1 Tax=Natronorubrum tibetense TaxID=63128 RepID=UPI000A7F79CD|nr:hypothetical protein [Natronorubrum tibetense]
MSDVAGIAFPVDGEILTLAETLDEGASRSSSVGAHLDAVRAAEALREREVDAPTSVRAIAPTLERALWEPDGASGDATASDLYVSGLRERRRELITATLASITDPSLVQGYEASLYSLRGLVAAVGRTLTATSADVVREHCLRTLAALGRVRPDVVQETLDGDAVAIGVDWLQRRETPEQWQETVVAELLAITAPALPSVWDDASIATVTKHLLASESATTRALARAVSRTAPAGFEGVLPDGPGKQPFEPLRRLGEDSSLGDREGRRLARAVGRCVALDPDLTADAPAALVERVRQAPRAELAPAATALGEVVANTVASNERTGAALVERVEGASGDARHRRVRLLGEVAVACPERVDPVSRRFRERVAAASPPDAAAVRGVGECVVAAAEDGRPLAVLRRQVRAGTGRERERAAVALGEWVAHVPDVVDAEVDSQAAVVRSTSGGDREAVAAVLGMYVVAVAAGGVKAGTTVVGSDASTRATRVRGERVLAGDVDGFNLTRETRVGLRENRGATRRFATQALGLALQYRESTGSAPLVAIRAAVTSSALDQRPHRLRLLGEWVAATGTSEGRVTALIQRVRKTTSTGREQAARALGVAMTVRAGFGARDAAAIGTAVARLAVHDEVVGATRRAVWRANPEAGDASTTRLPAGVPAVDRDWPLRALGEGAAVAGDSVPTGCGSLAATVVESDGWDSQSAARALGAALVLDEYPAPDVLAWVTTGFGGTPESRGAITYTLGEVAAAHPESFPGVPDTLVASVREASGTVRTTTARALGEYVNMPALAEPSSVNALQNAASDASGDARAHLTRALGEVLVDVPDPDIEAPALLVDAVADATGQDRRALARLLGELAVADDLGNVLDRVVPAETDASVFERARRSRMTQGLTAVDAVGVEDLLAALSVGETHDDAFVSSIDVDTTPVETLLESPPPIRDPLLDALMTALGRRATRAPGNPGTRFDAWLRESTDAEAPARLHAVAARSAVDTTAANMDR